MDDAVSVDTWVQERQSSSHNPLFIYKPQRAKQPDDCNDLRDEDFVLGIMTSTMEQMLLQFGGSIICVDTTHSTNDHDSHHPDDCVMVIDERECRLHGV